MSEVITLIKHRMNDLTKSESKIAQFVLENPSMVI